MGKVSQLMEPIFMWRLLLYHSEKPLPMQKRLIANDKPFFVFWLRGQDLNL